MNIGAATAGPHSYGPYSEYADSGTGWLGEVPRHWGVARLKTALSLSTERNGDEPVGDMLSVSGYHGVVPKVYEHDEQRRSAEDLRDYRVVRPGQLVANTMWLNYAGLGVSNYEGHVSPAYRCYNIESNFDGRFLHYLMRSHVYVGRYCALLYGIRPNSLQIKGHDWDCIELLIPPRLEQRAIAAFLDRETEKIDALAAKKERLIELLQEQRTALITQAVTKGLNPDVVLKDTGVEWLGEIPAHWQRGALARWWQVIDCRHRTVPFVNEGVPVASIGEVKGLEVDLSSAKHTTDDEYRDLISGGRDPRPGDIIYSRNATVGEAALVSDGPEFCMGQDVSLIRAKTGDSRYLVYLLRSRAVIGQLEALMVGSTFKRINVGQIKKFQVCRPPSDEQALIADYAEVQHRKIQRLIDKIRDAVERLSEYRTALVSAAVTGKIDVRNEVA